ncbi:MAG: 16S rRNA (adenine(1518)-N(6)/adenine(1519)-N(6))-dimethyltransferase RsmA [Anaerolineae bacterium]
MNDLEESVPALLRAYGLRPQKRLGQNFLMDPSALGRIIAAADLSPEDTVVEVGAGLGTLTRLLARHAGRVVAVELDARLVKVLTDRLADLRHLQIIQGDILSLSDLGVVHLGYKVVGNLPYYITSAILRHFLENEPRPRLLAVTVQREVAERIIARPPHMSLLAVGVQFYGRPRIVARIPAGAFYPPPKVDSAVVRIDVSEQPTIPLDQGLDPTDFFRVLRAGFGQKRKTLRNSLSAGLGIPPAQVEKALGLAGIDPRRRAETVDLAEWAKLARCLKSLPSGLP